MMQNSGSQAQPTDVGGVSVGYPLSARPRKPSPNRLTPTTIGIRALSNVGKPKTKPMQPHQQRVIEEKTELDAKLTKLGQFIDASPVLKTLDVAERNRLVRQRHYMGQYSKVLSERIEAFES